MKKFWEIIDRMVEVLLLLCERVMHKKIAVSTKQSLQQFVRFGVVGVSNTLISYCIYSAALLLFRRASILSGVDYIVAQVVQFILSVLWSYFWNNRYVFALKENENRSWWKSLVKTYVSYSFTGLFLSSILLIFWVKVLGISEFIAPILNLLISVPVNFLINKYWAFRNAE